MEKRLQDMQRLMQENEEAFARTQTVLEQYECKVNELNAQLEEEKNARKQLENLQYYLEEANRKLGLVRFDEHSKITFVFPFIFDLVSDDNRSCLIVEQLNPFDSKSPNCIFILPVSNY